MTIDKWLIGESVDGVRQYIVHTQPPRFIGLIEDDDGTSVINQLEWIDEPVLGGDPSSDAAAVAQLMREAGEALAEYDGCLDCIEESDDEQQ